MVKKELTCISFTIIFLLLQISIATCQDTSKTSLLDEFSGSIGITNNGISLVPTFSLGDPASILNIKMAKKSFSFEPEMRFALEGKPWSFLFWFRQKIVASDRFNLRVGMHPALNFQTLMISHNGNMRESIETRRFLAGELVPSYKISKNFSFGFYYLFSKGFDEGLKTAHFLLANINLSKLTIVRKHNITMNFVPQFYYLNLDSVDGFFGALFVTFEKQKSPWALQTILNKKFNSDIDTKNFVWNITLIYKFG